MKHLTQYRKLCQSYIPFLKTVYIPTLYLNCLYEAVLIEYRILPHLEFLVRNAIYHLGDKWSYTIICGDINYDYVYNLAASISPMIKIINTGHTDITVDTYNSMLYTADFWNLLVGEKILIYQEDSCIFKSFDTMFLQYDYIGAPWLLYYNRVGNGGFSLRTKSIMLQIINTICVDDINIDSNIKHYMINAKLTKCPEDIYFSTVMTKYNIGKLASFDIAKDFSTESIFNIYSFGGHQFWRCDKNWQHRVNNIYKYNANSDYMDISVDKIHYLELYYKRPNIYDIDCFFSSKTNDDIIRHPKQLYNLYNNKINLLYNGVDIYTKYLDNIVLLKDTINVINNYTYTEYAKLGIKLMFSNISSGNLLLIVFLGDLTLGINLIRRIRKSCYKNTSICFCINKSIYNKLNPYIYGFKQYCVYKCNEYGNDIVPSLLVFGDIINNYHFNYILKLHTKGIIFNYKQGVDFLLNNSISNLLEKKHKHCNCIGDNYICITTDIYNSQLYTKYNSLIKRRYFVGGTMFLCKFNAFKAVYTFFKNNYKLIILNNMYDDNTINKDNSIVHFLERLFGIIQYI